MEAEIGFSHSQIGFFILFLGMGYSIMLLFSGMLSQILGYRNHIAIFMFLAGLVLVAITELRNFYGLVAGFLFLGLSLGAYLPAAIPLITSSFSKWGRAIGLHDSGAPIAMILMPVMASILLKKFHWSVMLVGIGVTLMVVTLLFITTTSNIREQSSGIKHYFEVVSDRFVWYVAILWIIMAFSAAGLFSVLPLYLVSEKGFKLTNALYLLGIARLGGLSTPVIGIVSDRVGHETFLNLSVAVTGLLTLLIPLATPPYIGAILFLQAFFSSFFFPMAFVVVSKIIQKEDQSPALGFILFMGTLVGMGVLPKLLLDVAEVSGFSSGIIVMGLAVIVATIISVKISRTPPRVHASGNPTGLISR